MPYFRLPKSGYSLKINRLENSQLYVMADQASANVESPVHATGQDAPLFPAFFQNARRNGWLFFALALLLYAPTVGYEFVLDDGMLIFKNKATNQGLAGIPAIFTSDVSLGNMDESQQSGDVVAGGRYRPLSIAVFAVLFQVFGRNPLPFHLLTVLFYAACCLVFYRSLLVVFKNQRAGAWLAWLAALLFVVHPLHTEVVNNNKASDEILALAFCLGGLVFSLDAFRKQQVRGLLWAFLCFLAACFSKENAVMFVAVVPLTLWIFGSGEGQASSNRVAGILKFSLPVVAASAIFLLVRGAVLGWALAEPKLNLFNNAFIKWDGSQWLPFTFAERYATIFFTLGKYLWLHIFPHPLSHDYYPRAIAIQNFSAPLVLASVGAYAGMLAFGLWGVWRGKFRAASWGILVYLITLFIVSNIPVSLGTCMAERFAFMPSAGMCVALASIFAGLAAWRPSWAKGIFALFLLVSAAFSVKTVARSQAYASNRILTETDVRTVPNSLRIHYAFGGSLMKEARGLPAQSFKQQFLLKQAIEEFDKGIAINPTFSECFYARGSAHFLMGKYRDALADFAKSLSITPGRPEIINNYALALLKAAQEALAQGQSPEIAATYLQTSNQLVPNNPETLLSLALAQARSGDKTGAAATLNRVLQLDPNNQQARAMLQSLGQ